MKGESGQLSEFEHEVIDISQTIFIQVKDLQALAGGKTPFFSNFIFREFDLG